MSVTFIIVSIGTLSSNPFWKEPPGVRTAHATTTLVTDGDRRILVDPSLPDIALASRLFERTGLQCDDVTDVFCTTLRPTHRRALRAFPKARWLTNETELANYRAHLQSLHESSHRQGGELDNAMHADMEIVHRFVPAPDKLSEAVDLYPLPGPSVGYAGLLLAGPSRTVMIAGDAAITSDHVMSAQVWSGCQDVEAAMDSLTEVLEIADIIVCGHDNYMLSPGRWGV
jgi:glyoxylase-like metal-dependent hydrolase (beta-lactamase superfamily II)